MSGGYFDYLPFKVKDLADEVRIELNNTAYHFETEEYKALEVLHKLLEQAYEGAHLAEWWLSADTNSRKFVEWSKTV